MLKTQGLQTLEQVRAFLEGTQPLGFEAPAREAAYDWMAGKLRRLGNLGWQIWLMCQGVTPDRIHPEAPPPKTIGHGKVVPPGTRERGVLLTFFLHMSEKVGARLRRHEMEAQRFLVGWKGDYGWRGDKLRLPTASDDGQAIYRLCQFGLETH